LKSIFKFSLVIVDMSWHPTLWFQDDGICWNGCLQVLVFFLVFNVYPILSAEFHATVCNFARGFQLELIVTWRFFMQNLLKTRNYPQVGFERDLRSIPAENLEQKVENTQQNRHRFSFRWIS
jgi:hypothetical protein